MRPRVLTDPFQLHRGVMCVVAHLHLAARRCRFASAFSRIRAPMSDRLLRFASLASLAVVALAVLVVPTAAHAWGPLAHLGFSAQALEQLGTVPGPTRSLLSEFANEFLYGSLAADIVVGKNLARFVYHCHNWKVGFNVRRAASTAAEEAFALGFLAHLAADTIAHNYYVPYQIVSSFHRPRTGHAYWELRYDQRQDRELSRVARRVSARAYRDHDALLERAMPHASVIPFPLSKGLFGSLLASARVGRFQTLSRGLLARHRHLTLDDGVVEETNALAVQAILGLLREGERCEAARADATGGRNLLLAGRLRRELARRHRRLPLSLARELSIEARESFRRGIQGALVLPPTLSRMAA